MPAALPPDLATAYVRELSADVRAVVALGPGGELFAGPAALAAPARAFLAAATTDVAAERTPAGVVIAARAGGHAVVAVAGPLSLVGPTARDALAAAEALAAGSGAAAARPAATPAARPAATPAARPAASQDLRAAAQALISAAHSAI